MGQQITIHDLPLIEQRLDAALTDCRSRNLEPAWIILGQHEWLALKLVRGALNQWILSSDVNELPRYQGVSIATVPIAKHLEVLPKLPW